MLRLGWKAGTEQYAPEELLDYAIAAEEAGFDSVEASDHFHPWAEQGQACFVWSWLGAVAAKTKQIGLGTGVTCPILRYHPAVIAQAAATVERLAPKRFFLGVGTGEALNEYSATGQWPGYKTRRAQLAEAIELIRALWTSDKITHKGNYYQTRKAKLYTCGSAAIPLYVSTMVPDSAGVCRKTRGWFDHCRGRRAGYVQKNLQKFQSRRERRRQGSGEYAAHDRISGRLYG